MAGISMKRVRVAAVILASVGAVLTVAPKPAYGQSMPAYAETTADALARNVKILATRPKNFEALIGAGKAALDMGDAQAAAGFFGRAEEVNGNSPLPQIGMGAALVASGDAREALTYFARAQQLGAPLQSFACERGMAFDLLGQQPMAEADYRAALFGADRDEAQRRLALSQAIGGNKEAALATLQPLLQRGDPGASRVRSLVLALAGDLIGAKAALDSMIPGASRRMEPFFRQLPTLSAQQKAAAVHLGVFPSTGGQAGGDRLASIEELLRAGQPSPAPAQVAPQPVMQQVVQQPIVQQQFASAPKPVRPAARPSAATASAQSKVWLQLASGTDEDALPEQFKRIKRSTQDLLDGIDGYIADEGGRVRLLIGPFRNTREAKIFAEDLSVLRVDAFSWTNRPGQPVRKLTVE